MPKSYAHPFKGLYDGWNWDEDGNDEEKRYCDAFKQWLEECLDQGSKIGSNHKNSFCQGKYGLFYTKNFHLAIELVFRGDRAGFGL